jgi:uncharacterized protein
VKVKAERIAGPEGRLDAILNYPERLPAEPAWCAAVCHPHPLFGGTMHNKVVFHVARALADLGWPVVRFNYRGVGRSRGRLPEQEGHLAMQRAAGDDLEAVIRWLLRQYPSAQVCAAGFSFGAECVLRRAESDKRIARMLLVGAPAGTENFSPLFTFVGQLYQPKLFVQGDADEFGPPEAIQRLFAAAAPPKMLVMVPGAEHFFQTRLTELRGAAARVVEGFDGARPIAPPSTA